MQAKNYAFIDGNNLHHGIMSMGWKLDYERFKQYLREKYGVDKAFIFFGYLKENKMLYDMLRKHGYTIIFKPVLRLRDGSIKGNVDAELVLHAMIELEHFERAVIVTSDGDFACLVEYLHNKKRLAAVLSSRKEHSSVLLRRAAKGHIAFMNSLKKKLEYKK